MIDKLKPCPFCGGESDCNNDGFMKARNFMWAVECLTCGVTTDFFDTKSEAVDAWNRRVGNLE